MSYPQPNADAYAANSYEFFRLNTRLSSPGDIYRSPQGGHLFCLGPESDLANVNIAYFDDQAPTFLQTTQISPGRPFVGRVYARNDATYAPSNRRGQIFYWSDDIYDPRFRPRSFNANTDQIQFIAPQMDVIQYFTPLASVLPQRIDKSFVFQNYNINAGTLFVVVPYYGRKYCYIGLTNRNTTTATTFGILGVNYAITNDAGNNPYHQETVIRAPATVAANGGAVTRIVRAGTEGVFDALVFSLTNGGPAPLRITMSDQDQV